MQVFAVVSAERRSGNPSDTLALILHDVEIVDLRPKGLEDSLECLIETTLHLALLPRLRILVTNLAFQIGQFGSLTVGLTPTSAQLPFNPSIAADSLSACIDVI